MSALVGVERWYDNRWFASWFPTNAQPWVLRSRGAGGVGRPKNYLRPDPSGQAVRYVRDSRMVRNDRGHPKR